MSKENISSGTPAESTQAPVGLGSEAVEAPVVENVTSGTPKASLADLVSDEYKTNASISKFKDVDGLAKAYSELEKRFSKKIEDLSPEEISALDKKFGAPEKVDEYGIDLGEYKDDAVLSKVSDLLLKNGIPKDKGKALIEDVLKVLEEDKTFSETEAKVSLDKQVAELKREFGSSLEDRMKVANIALNKFGGEEAKKAIIEAGLQVNPAIVKMLANIGMSLSEPKIIGENKSSSFGMTPGEARDEIAKLNRDKDFIKALSTPSHPNHLNARKKHDTLFKTITGFSE